MSEAKVNIQLSMDVANVIYYYAFPTALRTLDESKNIRQEDGDDEYYQNGNEGSYTFIWFWQQVTDSC